MHHSFRLDWGLGSILIAIESDTGRLIDRKMAPNGDVRFLGIPYYPPKTHDSYQALGLGCLRTSAEFTLLLRTPQDAGKIPAFCRGFC
jgi:hypothetical protein